METATTVDFLTDTSAFTTAVKPHSVRGLGEQAEHGQVQTDNEIKYHNNNTEPAGIMGHFAQNSGDTFLFF